MKKINKILFAFTAVILLALAFPCSVSAAPVEDGKTIFGDNFTLESGKILEGDLNIIGGVVDIETDAVVDGSIFVLGGVVDIDGVVEGDLTVIGGTITLKDDAVIEGDMIAPAGFVDQHEGAMIKGDIIRTWEIPWVNFQVPQVHTPIMPVVPRWRILPALQAAKWLGQALVFVALGALMILIMPKATEEMTNALVIKPWHMLGYGTLTAAGMLVGSIILSLTICLIPVVILAGLTFGLALLAGWLALGYELGKRLAVIFKTTWQPIVSGLLGNLVLFLLALSLRLIPCLGGFLTFFAMLFGLGMAVTTLFGTKTYPRAETAASKTETVLLNDGLADETAESATDADAGAESSQDEDYDEEPTNSEDA